MCAASQLHCSACADGAGLGAGEFVVLDGIVRRGHLDAPAGRQVVDREVHHRRVAQADVRASGAAGGDALDCGLGQRLAAGTQFTYHDQPVAGRLPAPWSPLSRLRRNCPQAWPTFHARSSLISLG